MSPTSQKESIPVATTDLPTIHYCRPDSDRPELEFVTACGRSKFDVLALEGTEFTDCQRCQKGEQFGKVSARYDDSFKRFKRIERAFGKAIAEF